MCANEELGKNEQNMNASIKKVLSNPRLEVQREFVGEYQFQLTDIPVPITVRLYRQLGSDVVEFRQSHFIHTPVQGSKYMTSSSWGKDEKEALQRAVQTFVSFYEEAVRAGHRPAAKWLVKNDAI